MDGTKDEKSSLHVRRIGDNALESVTTFAVTLSHMDLIVLIEQAVKRRATARRNGTTLLLLDLLGILVAQKAMDHSPHLGSEEATCTFCGGPLRWLRMGALTIKQGDREFCDQICLESWQDEADAQRREADER